MTIRTEEGESPGGASLPQGGLRPLLLLLLLLLQSRPQSIDSSFFVEARCFYNRLPHSEVYDEAAVVACLPPYHYYR